MKRLSAIIVLVLMSALVIGTNSNWSAKGPISLQEDSYVLSQYTVHDPIDIESNAELIAQALDESWPGTGLSGNPYVIQGYNITSDTGSGIRIDDVDLFLIIRDCVVTLTGGGSGGSVGGIVIWSSENCVVDSNTVQGNRDRGILIAYSNGNLVSNNIVSGKFEGIELYYSEDCTITDNVLANCGVYISGYSDNEWRHEMSNNQINGKPLGYFWNQSSGSIGGADYGQIVLGNCSFMTIRDGNYVDSGVGLQLGFCEDCVIENCTIERSISYGVGFYTSQNCSLLNSTIEGSALYGINIRNSHSCIFIGNNLTDNYLGIYVSSSPNCLFEENSLLEGWRGIVLDQSTNCNFTRNTFENTGIMIYGDVLEEWTHVIEGNSVNGKDLAYYLSWESESLDISMYGQVIIANCTYVTLYGGEIGFVCPGVLFGLSSLCSLEDTVLSGGYDSVYVSDSHNCTMSNVTVQGSGWGGIIIGNSDNCTVTKCIVRSKSHGIWIRSSEYCNVINNTLTSSEIFLQSSKYCTVANNSITRSNAQGIYATSLEMSQILDNKISNCSGSGIKLSGSDNTIAGNIINCFVHGIYISESNNLKKESNKIIGNNGYGLHLDHVKESLIIANTITENLLHGLFLTIPSANNTIYDNVLGWNGNDNGNDMGTNNTWDNGLDTGNLWGDYYFAGPYYIPGPAGSVDRYPRKADPINPLLASLPDVVLESGSTGNWLNWTAFDEHPEICIILRNGSEWMSMEWNGTDIPVNLDALNLGLHNISIFVNDTCGNSRSDNLWVRVVDTTAPTISHHDDITYTEGQSGNVISWTIADFNPYRYEIYINDTLYTNNAWISSPDIAYVNVDGLEPGLSVYTIIAYDTSGNSIQDVVIVIVVEQSDTTNDTDTINDGIDPLLLVIIGAGITGIVIVFIVIIYRRKMFSDA